MTRKIRSRSGCWKSWRRSTTSATSTASPSSRSTIPRRPKSTASILSPVSSTSRTASPPSSKVTVSFASVSLEPHPIVDCYRAGDLTVEEQVLDWLIHQVESDEIEDVTDEMLDMLIKRSKHLAVLFCKLTSLLGSEWLHSTDYIIIRLSLSLLLYYCIIISNIVIYIIILHPFACRFRLIFALF